MKRFRKHVKQGSRLALFALAVQFALSFGHFHGLAAQAAPVAPSGAAVAVDTGSDTVGNETSSTSSPAGQDHDQQPADSCAICAVMALTGTAMVSPPPVLLLPEAFEFLYLAADAEFVHLKSVGRVLRPRVPPAS
jgi:Protein of unknown function (DUF2946)